MTAKILTQSRLKEALHYCPDTGAFTWKKRPVEDFQDAHACNLWNVRYPETEAGYIHSSGYRIICIFNVAYKAHRLAILHFHGSFPADEVDHINGVKDDNQIVNLRCVTHQVNGVNQRLYKNNSSGVSGVRWNPQKNRWCTDIGIGGRATHLGYFKDFFDAVCCRKAVETNEFVAYHKNHGRKA